MEGGGRGAALGLEFRTGLSVVLGKSTPNGENNSKCPEPRVNSCYSRTEDTQGDWRRVRYTRWE